MRAYSTVTPTPVKRHEAGDSLAMRGLSPTVDVTLLLNVTRWTNFDVQIEYRRYRVVVDEIGGFRSEVPAEIVVDLHDGFAQYAIWETISGFSLSTDDGLIIATALQRILNTVLQAGFEVADLTRSFVDCIESPRAATTA